MNEDAEVHYLSCRSPDRDQALVMLDRYAQAIADGEDGSHRLVGELMINAGLSMHSSEQAAPRESGQYGSSAGLLVSYVVELLSDSQLRDILIDLDEKAPFGSGNTSRLINLVKPEIAERNPFDEYSRRPDRHEATREAALQRLLQLSSSD